MQSSHTSPAHTGAPWSVNDDWPGKFTINGPKNEILAVVNEFGIAEINEANARLMAAAPTLLWAVKDAKQYIEFLMQEDGWRPASQVIVDTLSELIDRVEGRV